MCLKEDLTFIIVTVDQMNGNSGDKVAGSFYGLMHFASVHAFAAIFRKQGRMDVNYPVGIVCEEMGGDRADVGWFVDPLDGTANFVHGFPVVGVSVALVAEGRPVVGVVHAPMLGRIYAARLGGGATCNGEPVRVSTRDPEQAICATGFPFRSKRDRLPQYFPVFERALLTFEDLRRAGAASLDLSWTAAGVLDGYFEQALGTWDVAAGGLLVREAGGVVTDWQGDDRAWLDSGDIVAGPAPVHERILEVIAGGA